jgi:hypothetical protein
VAAGEPRTTKEDLMATTPGPWEIRPFDEAQTCILGPKYEGGQDLVAIVSVGKFRPNGDDNAKLIASAPDLAASRADLAAEVERLKAEVAVLRHDDVCKTCRGENPMAITPRCSKGAALFRAWQALVEPS